MYDQVYTPIWCAWFIVGMAIVEYFFTDDFLKPKDAVFNISKFKEEVVELYKVSIG